MKVGLPYPFVNLSRQFPIGNRLDQYLQPRAGPQSSSRPYETGKIMICTASRFAQTSLRPYDLHFTCDAAHHATAHRKRYSLDFADQIRYSYSHHRATRSTKRLNMTREEVLKLLRSGKKGIAEWNRRRKKVKRYLH